MPHDVGISAVGHAIQFAVAPVFLLAGIGGLLGVLTNRIARLIDRSRVLDGLLANRPPDAAAIHVEFQALSRRARLISTAITSCTLSALLICAVIATLFVEAFAGFDASAPVALLFIAAMIALIAALLFFLREVLIGTSTLRIGPPQ